MAESPSVFRDRQSSSTHTSALPSPALARRGSSSISHASSPQPQQPQQRTSSLLLNASTPQGPPLSSPTQQQQQKASSKDVVANTQASSPSSSAASTDVDRGWDAQGDNRFRVPLLHNNNNPAGMGSATQRARFFDDINGDNLDESATHLLTSLRNIQTSPHGITVTGGNHSATATTLNGATDDEPRLEMTLQSSMINFIVTAYTSSGYPTTVTSGLARGSVNGAFVDLRNPSQSVLNLPPRTSLFVSSVTDSPLEESNNSSCYMDTLMKVMWRRSTHLFASDTTAPAAMNTTSGGGGGSNDAAGANNRATNNPAANKPTSGLSVLQQYPDGIHGVHSSPNLRRILLEGKMPSGDPSDAPALPPNASLATAGANNNNNGGETTSETRAQTENASNAPPAPLPARYGGPVQHTLLVSSSYNHLTIYFVAHQAGRILYSAPLQTLSASIWGHKVTAQCVLLHGWEEVDPRESGPAYFTPTPSGPWSAEAAVSHGATTSNSSSSGVRQRPPIPFRTLQVNNNEDNSAYGELFESPVVQYRGADANKKTVQAALVGFALQPLLLIGNQAGDVLLYDILQEKVVQRLNFAARQTTNSTGSEAGTASGSANNNNVTSSNVSNGSMVAGSAPVMNGMGSLRNSANLMSGSARAGGKIVASAVSTIVEVQNGLEKKLTSMLQAAASAKRQGRKEFALPETTSHTRTMAYYSLSPSLFAVGFDNGQALLICLTMEAAWVLKWFDNTVFGVWPITHIAPRVPDFFMRLWNVMPGSNTTNSNSSTGHHRSHSHATPCTTLVTPIQALIVPDETAHIAAVACNNGTIMLVRLPGLERLTSISAYDYHAVGGILALCWTASTPAMLMTPDVLIASGEDDTVTAFQLLHAELYNAHFSDNTGTGGGVSEAGSGVYGASEEGGVHGSYSLRVMIKKLFHRSWVSHLALLPIPAHTHSSNNNNNVSLASSSSFSVSPYLGTCLVATSYDSRTSFWPILFHDTLGASSGEFPQADVELAICTPTRSMASMHSRYAGQQQQQQQRWMLIDGPTAAPVLHKELTLSAIVGGAGSSFFLATLCCRGRVKLWSIVPKSTAGILD